METIKFYQNAASLAWGNNLWEARVSKIDVVVWTQWFENNWGLFRSEESENTNKVLVMRGYGKPRTALTVQRQGNGRLHIGISNPPDTFEGVLTIS